MKKDKNKVLQLTSFFLGLTWYISWIVLGFYILSSAVVPLATFKEDGKATYVNAFPIHFEVPAPAQDPNVTIETGSNSKAIAITQADGIISFSTSDIKISLLATLGMVLDSMAILFVIFQLRKIVGKVKDGKPFMNENLGRIRKIAIAIFAYSMLKGVYAFVISGIFETELYVQTYMPTLRVGSDLEIFNSNLILLVLIILVIEQSFRIGLKLQEDKDLTI